LSRLSAALIFSKTRIEEMVELATGLEQGGFERVWLGEAWREPVVPMTAVALGTKTIGVGSAVSQIYPVNPVIVAQQAAQLQELTAGRFALGIGLGAGFVVERWFGVAYERPLRRAREFIEILRGVLASPERGPFTYEGELLSTRKYLLPFADQAVTVPIHLAAIGPKMQELAGELADGIIVGALHSRDYMEETRARLAAGAAKVGRDVNDIQIWYYLTCCVSEDGDHARQLARRSLVYLAQYPHYQHVYDREGFGVVTRRMASLVREHEMLKAEVLVSDQMIERFCVAGTLSDCREQLRRFDSYPGVGVLHMVPFRIEEDEVRQSVRLAARLLEPSSQEGVPRLR
jgi:alkanesulfonate monooxygenase SsuD/methylene tetrahydromethanopterin reductase-like flavin-dependent oxidoreductase (luciferase family)